MEFFEIVYHFNILHNKNGYLQDTYPSKLKNINKKFLLQAINQSVEDEYIELLTKAPLLRNPNTKLEFQV